MTYNSLQSLFYFLGGIPLLFCGGAAFLRAHHCKSRGG
jgi:hypothetical protein